MEQYYPFYPIKLDYEFSEFVPDFDPDTIYVHYEKVYKEAVQRLNYMISLYPQLQKYSLKDMILLDLPFVPMTSANQVKYYAGSVHNHGLFFSGVTPKPKEGAGKSLKATIIKRYGGMEDFKALFLDAAVKLMDCGFVWLNSEKSGEVHISITQNYLTPHLRMVAPLFTFDTWEHAYYLKYPADMVNYYKCWFDYIDWEAAELRYLASLR